MKDLTKVRREIEELITVRSEVTRDENTHLLNLLHQQNSLINVLLDFNRLQTTRDDEAFFNTKLKEYQFCQLITIEILEKENAGQVTMSIQKDQIIETSRAIEAQLQRHVKPELSTDDNLQIRTMLHQRLVMTFIQAEYPLQFTNQLQVNALKILGSFQAERVLQLNEFQLRAVEILGKENLELAAQFLNEYQVKALEILGKENLEFALTITNSDQLSLLPISNEILSYNQLLENGAPFFSTSSHDPIASIIYPEQLIGNVATLENE
jgi:hypothetical protein